MADPRNVITHLLGDAERQRHLARMQQLRNEAAAFNMLKVATVIQGGAAANETKGVMPFALRSASQGMATMVTGGTPFAPVRVYTPAAVEPVRPAKPAKSAPRRKGRSRR
jgi:hypothetical protein